MDIVFSRTVRFNNKLYSFHEYILEVTIPESLRMARHMLLEDCSVLNSNAWQIEFRYAGNGVQGGDEIITVTTPDETIACLAEVDLAFWLTRRANPEAEDVEVPKHEGWQGEFTLTV